MKKWLCIAIISFLIVPLIGHSQSRKKMLFFAKQMRSNDPFVRAQAVLDFGPPKTVRGTKLVFSHIMDKHKIVREAVVKTLGKSKDSSSLKWIARVGLAQRDVDTVIRVIEILGRARARHAVPKLIRFLKARREKVYMAAVYALSEMPERKSVVPLIELLKKAPSSQKFLIARALHKIVGRDFGIYAQDWRTYWKGYGDRHKIKKVHDPCDEKKTTGTVVQLAGYSQRFGSARRALLQKYGGSSTTESMMEMGLDWLHRHQNPDGRWSCARFPKHCKGGKCGHAGRKQFDVGVTGLSLLAYLGAGYTQIQGKYKDTVLKALLWLKKIQKKNGMFHRNMYNHGLATFAMAEAYLLTRDCRIRNCLQKALNFICKAQKPYAGWRYRARPADTDTSVSGWQIMALETAKMAPDIRIPMKNRVWAGYYLDDVTLKKRGNNYGFVRYKLEGSRNPEAKKKELKISGGSPATTAVGAYCRLLLGESVGSELVQGAVSYLQRRYIPRLTKVKPMAAKQNLYYWYYGTLLMFQNGGKLWDKWNEKLIKILTKAQIHRGCARGSFPADQKWGHAGGRVYSTAVSVLILQVYYRYGKK